MLIGFVLFVFAAIFIAVFVAAFAPPTQLVARWTTKDKEEARGGSPSLNPGGR